MRLSLQDDASSVFQFVIIDIIIVVAVVSMIIGICLVAEGRGATHLKHQPESMSSYISDTSDVFISRPRILDNAIVFITRTILPSFRTIAIGPAQSQFRLIPHDDAAIVTNGVGASLCWSR